MVRSAPPPWVLENLKMIAKKCIRKAIEEARLLCSSFCYVNRMNMLITTIYRLLDIVGDGRLSAPFVMLLFDLAMSLNDKYFLSQYCS